MSLDVYLYTDSPQQTKEKIFIRENGACVEVSRAEWDRRFPGCEPITVTLPANGEVFWKNITHNLGKMADAAGIYKHLWRPEELGITTAGELVEPLYSGLETLQSDPDNFRTFNPANGWGNYEILIDFVKEYLAACERHPEAKITISR